MLRLLVLLIIACVPAVARAGVLRQNPWGTTMPPPATPKSGAPFELEIPLGTQPSYSTDMGDKEMLVSRLLHKTIEEDTASPHACDMGDQADRDGCLHVEGRQCMWTRVETRDPLKRIQASNSYCFPCELDDEAIPCWNVGAWVDGKQVTNCEMSCNHQEKLMQQNYVCSDDTGSISQPQCFGKGTATGSRCMWTQYETSDGESKASCGPCELPGTGGWGCATEGQPGPVEGSKVKSCLSQCDVLCSGPPACPPTVAPPPPPPPPSPGVADPTAAADKMVQAPFPGMIAPTVNPWTIVMSAREAALKAGFQVGTTPPIPKVYMPVIFYRGASDNLLTTGAPPIAGPEPPLPISAALLQSPAKPPTSPLDELDWELHTDVKPRTIETPLRRLKRLAKGR